MEKFEDQVEQKISRIRFPKWIDNQVSWRQTEPNSLHSLKLLFRSLIYLGCVGYFILLIYEVAKEQPIVQEKAFPQDEIGLPIVYIFGLYNFTLDCGFNTFSLQSGDISVLDTENCTGLLSQPVYDETDKSYTGVFIGADSPTFSAAGVQSLEIIVKLADPHPDLSENLDMFMSFYDADTSFGVDRKGKLHSDVLLDLGNQNLYVVAPYSNNYVAIQRHHNITLQGGPRSTFGVPPGEDNEDYFLTTIYQSSPPANLSSFNAFSKINVRLQTHQVLETTQVKSKDILGAFSALGGGLTFGLTIYGAFFGAEPIQPWGFVQYLPALKQKIFGQFLTMFGGHIPLVNPRVVDPAALNESGNNPASPIQVDRIALLEKRCADLELLLKEYVVDVGFLEKSVASASQARPVDPATVVIANDS